MIYLRKSSNEALTKHRDCIPTYDLEVKDSLHLVQRALQCAALTFNADDLGLTGQGNRHEVLVRCFIFPSGNQEKHYTFQAMNNDIFTASRNVRTGQRETNLQFC